jgi:hypothetical protein
MSNYLDEVRGALGFPLRTAIEKVQSHIMDPDFIDRMKEIFSIWRIEDINEEFSSYNRKYALGFGIPVKIGLRTNDEVHFKFNVNITRFKAARKGCDREILLDFCACRGDTHQDNIPVKIPLAAAESFDTITEQLAGVNTKDVLNKACFLLFEEDFLRNKAGLPPRI